MGDRTSVFPNYYDAYGPHQASGIYRFLKEVIKAKIYSNNIIELLVTQLGNVEQLSNPAAIPLQHLIVGWEF